MTKKVNDIMTRDPSTVSPTDACGQAATLMKQEDAGSLPVVEGTRLIGIITDRDIVVRVVAAGKDPKSTPVSEAMSADPRTIRPDESTDDAQRLMSEHQIRRLPVVEDGRLVGIVAIGQIARHEDEDETGETLKEISQPSSGLGSRGRG